MRWTLRIGFLLLLALAIFTVSPFVALYDLAKAVETKDLARISERVNFRALRASFTRQIVGDYLKTQELGDLSRQFATEAGAAILNPLVEELLTPLALVDLLEDGWPQQAAGTSGAPVSPLNLNGQSLKTAWRTFIASESHGFRSVTIPLPEGVSKEKQFRITMRLSGTTWRLTGVDLPQDLREELIRRAPSMASQG